MLQREEPRRRARLDGIGGFGRLTRQRRAPPMPSRRRGRPPAAIAAPRSASSASRAVEVDVGAGHHRRGEARARRPRGPGAGRASRRRRTAATASSSEATTKPVTPSSTTSGTEPRRQATTGVPQAMASIMARPNGSGQSIGNRSAAASPRNAGLLGVADLADELDQRVGEQRLDHPLEVGPVGRVDLGRDLEPEPRAPGDRDRPVGPLLRRDAAEEGEVAALGLRGEAVELLAHAVRDGGDPVGAGGAAPAGRREIETSG